MRARSGSGGEALGGPKSGESALRAGAVVVAAGRGRRFGGRLPKQFLPIAGRPIVVRAAAALLAHPAVAHAVIVLPKEGFSSWRERLAPFLAAEKERISWCAGGPTRQDSVRTGLDVLEQALPPAGPGSPEPKRDLVAVHDGARPGTSRGTITRVLAGAARHGAAIPVLQPADTLWSRNPLGFAGSVIDRERTAAAQTPQGFRRALLSGAMRKAAAAGFQGTDEASAVRFVGHPVRLVEGNPANLKVTRRSDLVLTRYLLEPRSSAPRTGIGFDAHRFGDCGTLRLGGIRFPGIPALAGHSDGDALLHALTDAILGAAAAPDIGTLFPSSDASLRGSASTRFLARAVEIAAAAGYQPGQADCVVIARQPRLASRIAEIRNKLAGLLAIPKECVGVKATTTDSMGATGRGEGLAAQAVVRLDALGEDRAAAGQEFP